MNDREQRLRQTLLRVLERDESASAGASDWFDEVVSSFIAGCQVSLVVTDPRAVPQALKEQFSPFWRAYAYEGAGMGLAMLDLFSPGASCLRDGLQDWPTGRVERSLAWIGVGWALSRLKRAVADLNVTPPRDALGVVVDGYAFQTGFFGPWKFLEPCGVARPRMSWLAEHGAAYDHGLGRSLWFIHSGRPAEIQAAVDRFEDPVRRDSLWLGIGVACAFTGGTDASALRDLLAASRSSRAALISGATTGVLLRFDLSGPSEQARLAAETICGQPLESLRAPNSWIFDRS